MDSTHSKRVRMGFCPHCNGRNIFPSNRSDFMVCDSCGALWNKIYIELGVIPTYYIIGGETLPKGKYPTHRGDAQIFDGKGGYVKIGDSTVWLSDDKRFMSGILKFDASKVEPDEEGFIEVRFMAK